MCEKERLDRLIEKIEDSREPLELANKRGDLQSGDYEWQRGFSAGLNAALRVLHPRIADRLEA